MVVYRIAAVAGSIALCFLAIHSMKRRAAFTVDSAAILAFLAVNLAEMQSTLSTRSAQVIAIENGADPLFNQGHQVGNDFPGVEALGHNPPFGCSPFLQRRM